MVSEKKAALVFIEQEIFKVLPLHQMIHGFWVKVRVIESALSHPSKMVEHYTCVQPLQPEFVSGSQEIFVMTVASCEILASLVVGPNMTIFCIIGHAKYGQVGSQVPEKILQNPDWTGVGDT